MTLSASPLRHGEVPVNLNCSFLQFLHTTLNLRGFLFRSVQLLCAEYRDSAKIVTKHINSELETFPLTK